MFALLVPFHNTRFVLYSSLVLLMLLLATVYSGRTQPILSTPIHHHFGIDEGLQTEHIYDVVQDYAGYIWLATDVGIVRFDGHHFRHYGKADGIWTDAFFSAQLASDSCVWFLSHNRKLVGYDPRTQRLFQPPFNDQLARETRGIFRSLHIEGDTFFIACTHEDLWKVYPDSDSSYKVENVALPNDQLCLYQHPSGAYSHRWKTERVTNKQEEERDVLTWMPHNDSSVTIRLPHKGERGNGIAPMHQDQQGRFYFTLWNDVYRFTPEQASIETWSASVPKTQGLYVDDQERVWVGTRNKGVWVIETNTDSAKPAKYLQTETVSDIYQDKSNGLWISTLGSGLYYFPSTPGAYFTLSGKDETRIRYCVYNGHLFWYLTYTGAIGFIEPHGERWRLVQMAKYNHEPGYTHLHKRSLYVNMPREYLQVARYPEPTITTREAAEGRFFRMNDGTFFRFIYRLEAGQSEPFMIRLVWDQDTVKIPWSRNWPRRFTCGESGNVMFSTRNHQVFFYDRQTNKIAQVKPVDRLIPAAEHLLFTSGDTAWALTTSHGLFQIARDSIIDHIPLSLKYPLLKCFGMVQEGRNILVATNQGILRFNLQTRETFWITKEHGLVSNLVYSVALSPTHLLAGTSKGPCLIARNSWDSVPPPVTPSIEYVRLADSVFQKPTVVMAPYNYNDLQIAWTSFSYPSAFETRYRYRLTGTHERWTETRENTVNLPYLSSGSYVFEVQTGNAQGDWSASLCLPLEVATPFWMNGWFYTSLIVIVLALAFWISYIQVKRARASARIRQSLYLAQNQALSAQLNPHFIHNAMNSVTAFIANRDQRAALKYLAQLSGLMRRIFENSQEILIPLEEELASLEHYLELERVRFEERFSYRFEVDPAVDISSVLVPSLLLQPFVENALRHGILPLPDQGEVRVEVYPVKDGVACRIIDNGVGRQSFGKRRTRSSLYAIEHRLKMIRTLFHTAIQVEIHDLRPGTEVILTFPHTYKTLYPETLDY